MRLLGKAALFVAINMVSVNAFAAAYGTAGCGLGSIVFGAKPGIMQIFAATTNTTGVQTFGITTGTSNCDDKGAKDKGDDEGKKEKHKKKGDKGDKGEKGDKDKGDKSSSIQEQTDFIAVNMNSLKHDAAQGEGESLAALASTLGCNVAVYPKFTRSLKAAHGKIFAAKAPADVLNNIKTQVRADKALDEACDVAAVGLASAK